MDTYSIILLILLLLTFLLIVKWCIQALNEDYGDNIKFNNIYAFIEYHHKYLLKSYLRTDNKEIIKKLEIKIKEDFPNDFDKIANILDDITIYYRDIGNILASRTICQHALRLRKWYLPEKHPDIEKNIDDLINIHSSLQDNRAARCLFEYKMERINYFSFLNIKKS